MDNAKNYVVKSNRESGFGRYDVLLIPVKNYDHGIVIEFKVMGSDNEKSLEETCSNALRQIHEKQYTKELQQHHIRHIYVYGFAFKGKEVLICGGEEGDVALENSLQ